MGVAIALVVVWAFATAWVGIWGSSPAYLITLLLSLAVAIGLVTWALVRLSHPAIWVPLALVQGFTIFNFTVLLHEVVHHAVFAGRRPLLERLLL